MQQENVQEAEQIAMLADAKNLGQLEGIYRQNVFLVYLLGCALLFFWGGLAELRDMLFTHPMALSDTNDTPLWIRIVLITISIFSLLISLVIAHAVLSMSTDKILLYEHGVIIKRSQQLQAICWNEVRCVEPGFFYHSQYAWDFYYQLRLKDGRTVDFRNLRLFRRIDRKLKYQRS